jgi:hypothetical protein
MAAASVGAMVRKVEQGDSESGGFGCVCEARRRKRDWLRQRPCAEDNGGKVTMTVGGWRWRHRQAATRERQGRAVTRRVVKSLGVTDTWVPGPF